MVKSACYISIYTRKSEDALNKVFSFDLGNRGLLPVEVELIDSHNRTLQRSAAQLKRKLKEHALITVKIETVGEHRIYRAASQGQEPKVLPLASAQAGKKVLRSRAP